MRALADRRWASARRRETPQVFEASHVSGAFDYLLKVMVADMPEWTRIGEQLTAAEVGADRINTHVLLGKPKIFVGYPVSDR